MVEVQPGSECQLLAGQSLLAAGEQRSQPDLGLEDLGPALAALRRGQLMGVGPPTLGHLFSAPVTDPRHQGLVPAHGVEVGVGDHQPKGVQGPVEDRQILAQLILAGFSQPASSLIGIGERAINGNDRGPAGTDRRRVRLYFSLRLGPATRDQVPALRRTEDVDDQDVRGGSVDGLLVGAGRAIVEIGAGVSLLNPVTKQVSPGRWAERPRQLELAEAKQARGRRRWSGP